MILVLFQSRNVPNSKCIKVILMMVEFNKKNLYPHLKTSTDPSDSMAIFNVKGNIKTNMHTIAQFS